MLSVDPLYEMFPGISPYAYVLNNPIRYTDPTGMAAEENDCGIGCGLRKIFNTILYPNRSQLPDGKIERSGTKGGTSRATGWKFPKKREKSNNESQKKSEKRTPTTIVSQLNLNDIVSQSFIPQANVQLPNLNPINNSIKVDDREIDIGYEPQSVNFQFAQIGSVASQSTDGVRTGTNRILPLTNTQQQNLQAIANYLVEKPQATVRLQYPTPLNSSHVNFNADIRAVYNMSFQQITNFTAGRY